MYTTNTKTSVQIFTNAPTIELVWAKDCTIAQIYFDDEMSDFETTSSNVYKYKDTPCKDLTPIHIAGYCQRDWAVIKIPTSWLVDSDTDWEKYFTQLFYDAPIKCTLERHDDYYYIDEYYSDLYDTSKDALIEALTKWADKTNHHCELSIILEAVKSLPDFADYI